MFGLPFFYAHGLRGVRITGFKIGDLCRQPLAEADDRGRLDFVLAADEIVGMRRFGARRKRPDQQSGVDGIARDRGARQTEPLASDCGLQHQ